MPAPCSPEESSERAARSRLSADIDLHAEGKAAGFVRVPHSVHRSAYGWIPVPIVRIRNGEGPTVLLVAGNHGDEWEGQIGLGNLIRNIEPDDIRGRLLILPSANFPAALEGRRTSPIDQGNLNRAFPGDANGTITQQIAYWIEHALLPGCDYAFDFHSGGSSLIYIPSALVAHHPEPAILEKTIGLAKAFGAPVTFISRAPGGERALTSAASRQGVVALTTELGGGGFVTPASLSIAEQGMRRVLAHVGLLQGPVPPPASTRLTETVGDDYYVYASEGGLFEPLVELGQEVNARQPAGRIHFHHTPWREPAVVAFQRPGLVICKRVPAHCERGDCLFQLATTTSAY
ncbi:succinylglutamate desuccinylase/aspartoacylase family protein [Reyranella sp.]|uniref:succinylglutamate desuccinylase/aspartoacylase family protein n=1 Tax=Reyranella sp. TaxID=1929291 RepID=UPI003C7A9F54